MGGNGAEVTVHDEENFRLAHDRAGRIRGEAARLIKEGWGVEALELYKRTLLFDAP